MKKKDKLKCQTCANSVNGDYCTMGKVMDIKRYKRCEGYKLSIPKPKPIEIVKPKTIRETDYESLGEFGGFLKKGGHYSLRLNL